MDRSKNIRWIIPFEKFSMVRVKNTFCSTNFRQPSVLEEIIQFRFQNEQQNKFTI